MTVASPGTFFTVSGTARMVPAEDLKVHIGSKQRVDIVYYHLAFNKQPTVERTNSYRYTDSMKLLGISETKNRVCKAWCIKILL